ncbi:AP2-ERF domain [Babesia duncani]|uniref:AP2-ERF domain n=1 Tax=Babesia duncani TaxID=323732 RepID=A0AAD9PLH4_9APIC|nr:AP2-ERF domain [Babesia duncani]
MFKNAQGIKFPNFIIKRYQTTLESSTRNAVVLDSKTFQPTQPELPREVAEPAPFEPNHPDHCKSSQRDLVEHTFRWGIGNKYRSQSANRYRPTHAQRPTRAWIRGDYFTISKFKHCEMLYDKVNEQWEVQWQAYGKLNGKPFPVKKFGIEASKREAIAFAKNLDNSIANQQTEISTETATKVIGRYSDCVKFDSKLHCWVGLGRIGTRPVVRAFSADYHGDKAMEMAIKMSKRQYTNNN